MQMHMQCLDYATHMIQSRRFKPANNQRVRTVIVNGNAVSSDRRPLANASSIKSYDGKVEVGGVVKLSAAAGPTNAVRVAKK